MLQTHTQVNILIRYMAMLVIYHSGRTLFVVSIIRDVLNIKLFLIYMRE